MGVAQSSAMKLTGAIAGAALGIAQYKEKADLAEEQGLLAKEQYHEASASLKQLEGEQEEAAEELTKANEAFESTKGWDTTGANKAMLEGKVKKRLTEKEAAQRAFDELQDRIDAKLAMQLRAEKIMKRTGTWGGNL